MSVTIVTLNLGDPGPYPEVRIEELDDARTLVDILNRNGIQTNLRGTA
jgi:hypothetical protein